MIRKVQQPTKQFAHQNDILTQKQILERIQWNIDNKVTKMSIFFFMLFLYYLVLYDKNALFSEVIKNLILKNRIIP